LLQSLCQFGQQFRHTALVNHKFCHLQQRLATIDIYARLEGTLRVHLHESFQEVPLEQTFPINTKTTLRDIIIPILPQTRTFIFGLACLVPAWHSRVTRQEQPFCSPAQGKYQRWHRRFPYVTCSRFADEQTKCHDLARYNFSMARGWESKSVEEQQAQAFSPPGPAPPPLTPAQIATQRLRKGLLLSRQHVLQQLEAAQNPRHRQILQNALADLDAQLARLV
jgi:hypothetical protein